MRPTGERRSTGSENNNSNSKSNGNSAPSNRMLRAGSSTRLGSLSSLRDFHSEEAKLIERRSRKVTVCLICLISSISCLTPFVSLHLTQRVGLLLFESDLIQLRSSLFTLIVCLLVLVFVYIILFFNYIKTEPRRSLVIQKLIKHSMGAFAIISAISYLSIVLIVPQIRQIQRMPLATFDCNANLITIENCQQQFTTKGGEQTLPEAISELLSGDLNGNNERLIKKLNCLKYNDKELDALQVPTRFLLHKCGLVCKPQRQQSHQFSDDLNRDQINLDWSVTMPKLPERNIADAKITLDSGQGSYPTSAPQQEQQSSSYHPLVPPYNNDLIEPQKLKNVYLNHLTYTHNASAPQTAKEDHPSTRAVYGSLNEDASELGGNNLQQEQQQQRQQQVSLKVCFSGEFSGGSNYKQFCITNLANNVHGQDHTLTVGQLNAMLRKFMPTSSVDLSATADQETLFDARASQRRSNQVNEADQSTQYMNPVVQFESHFKNWPQLSRSSLSQPQFSGNNLDDGLLGGQVINGPENDNSGNSRDGWCSFRPIPPFIVNNKPFSDIQCSLEHEYTMTTGPSLDSVSFSGRGADKIYLKKSSAEGGGTGGITRERCNIQCKVNILYQVHMSSSGDGGGSISRRSRHRDSSTSSTKNKDDDDFSASKSPSSDDYLHYYLPLKPCLIVSDDGDKTAASNYYITFRTIGDSSLVLVLIFLDLFLFLESIDTKQFQLEAKKARLIGLLLVIALMPPLIALLFDLISVWQPNQFYNKTRKDGYLTAFISDRVIPNFIDLFSSSSTSGSTSASKMRKFPANLDQSNNLKPDHTFTGSNNKVINEFDKNTNPKRNSVSAYQLDSYMLPFFVYSTLMFVVAINSFTLPLVSSTTQLARVSSTEELGIANSKVERRVTEKGNKRQSKNNQQQQPANVIRSKQLIQAEAFKQLFRKQTGKLISLALIALFLGTQFNLSQLAQTHFFLDTFGHLPPTGSMQASMQSFGTFWFALQTHSSAAIFVLLLVLLSIEETSTFFAGFSPFKSATSAHATPEESRRNRAKFLNYITISILIYSFRHYALASLSIESSFKWLVVFLFQLAELFNFPLTWFALTTRAHEILLEYRARHNLLAAKVLTAEPEAETARHLAGGNTTQVMMSKHATTDDGSRAKAVFLHVVVQSAAAFTYFVLSRSLAFFVHSLNASLHLHSDNVDWFITGFHKQHLNTDGNRRRESSPTSINVDAKQNNSIDGQQQQQRQQQQQQPQQQQQQQQQQQEQQFTDRQPPESLFSPLPGERQTYLHASRLFLRYNSLLCLSIGLILLGALIYVKYQIWADQKRTLDVYQSSGANDQTGADENSIVDRLSLDLMRIHSEGQAQMRTIYPKPFSPDVSSDKHARRPQSPRAKILFHYNLGRRESSSSTSSLSSVPVPAQFVERSGTKPKQVASVRERQSVEGTRFGGTRAGGSSNELRIPIEIVGTLDGEDEDGQFREVQVDDQLVERITEHRHKRVRIFEDRESWPNEGEEIQVDKLGDNLRDAPEPVEKIEQREEILRGQPKITTDRSRKRRTISFAPTATLIGDDGASDEQKRIQRSHLGRYNTKVQRASPEPSIDNESELGLAAGD